VCLELAVFQDIFVGDGFLIWFMNITFCRLRAICNLDQGKGLLTVADFKAANSSLHPQFKREALQGTVLHYHCDRFYCDFKAKH